MPSTFVVGAKCDRLRLDSAEHLDPEISSTLSEFSDSLSRPLDDTSERPAKKRRLDADDPSASISSPQDQPEDYATLVDCTLELSADSSWPRPAQDLPEGLHSDGVPIVLDHFRSRQGAFPCVSITLSSPSKQRSETLTLSLSVRRHDEAYQHLRHASLLTPRRATTKRLAPSEICWVECYLNRHPQNTSQFSLRIKICWKSHVSLMLRNQYKDHPLPEMFRDMFPSDRIATSSRSWSPYDFYSNVHIPDPSMKVSPALQHTLLDCDLYPFQKRAVDWLLRREGVAFGPGSRLEPLSSPQALPTSFEPFLDAHGNPFHVSQLLKRVEPDADYAANRMDLKGGILAEEMGLGKTVELVALILAHQRTGDFYEKVLDRYSGSMVSPSRSTLIITPPAILEQWMKELATHAPSLKVYHYTGIKSSNLTEKKLRDELMRHDVVLTTYHVLAREIHYTDDKPQRNLRHSKRYVAPRTPLIMIGWWRVCLDEAQMIENGVSNAAKVARLIPRCNAWAVSGTPLRKDITDLLGLLIFLRYEPFCNMDVWQHMIVHHQHLLGDIFGRIAMRHTKSKIRDELVLPPQKRMVITVPFMATEEQNYNDLYRQMCDECGLNQDGSPMLESWDPDSSTVIERMRSWLTRLRQTCLHAEIGLRNRRALGNKMGPLRTVEEVLEVMIDQNEVTLRLREREALSHKLTRGHIYTYGKASRKALQVYLEALEDAKALVSETRTQLEEEKTRIAQKGDAEVELEPYDSESDEVEEDDKKGKLGACRQRLRSALEMLHTCYFFTGTAYFQIKDDPINTHPASEAFLRLEEQEAQCYEEAKIIRKELLREVTKKTTRLIDKVVAAKEKSLVQLSPVPSINNARGLESRKITEAFEKLRHMLNEQTTAFNDWRSRLISTLVQKLLDQDEDVEMTGEEYELTTHQQHEQYLLLEALRCVQSDRQCMITGQIGTLVNYEMKVALKQAKSGTVGDPENKGPLPELTIAIMAARESFNPPENIRATIPSEAVSTTAVSLRGIMTDLRHLITSVQWQGSDRSKLETQILEEELHNLQRITNAQTKELTAVEKEIDLLRSTMNQRLEFYRQLQQISDDVAPFKEEAADEVDYQRLDIEQEKEERARERMSVLRTKRRFLQHLRNAESNDGAESQFCIICQSPFETGVLTVCGHQYCKECIAMWWGQHKNCPMCKTMLKRSDFHDITYKPKELKAQEETSPIVSDEENESPSKASSSRSSIYSDINPVTLEEIKTVELPGSQSFGVKIDTLSRHILWIRQNDPGSKCVVFSQYRDFLTVLSRAFKIYNIGYSEIGAKGGIELFRSDPSIECFLLHAKAESSGLTLVNATHVFLCEPLINTAIELQAIARVHRIGQRRPTTVWMYLVANTVEEAIYDISVSRRLAHMQKSGSSSRHWSRAVTPATDDERKVEESKLDAANSHELQTVPVSKLLTKGQSGGEIVGKEDLWNCLFSKPRGGAQSAGGALEAMNPDGPAAREMSRFMRAEAAESRQMGE